MVSVSRGLQGEHVQSRQTEQVNRWSVIAFFRQL